MRLSDGLNRLMEVVVSLLGIAMACVMGLQVIARYVFNHSLFWSEEVGRISLVWLTFLGATIVYKRKLHIGIDMVVRRFPLDLRRYIAYIVWSISLAFFLVMVVVGTRFLAFVSMQQTAALSIPLSYTYAVIPTSGLICAIHGISFFMEHGGQCFR